MGYVVSPPEEILLSVFLVRSPEMFEDIMSTQQLLSALTSALAGRPNGQAQHSSVNKGKEPSGIITVSLGERDRLEARYWENPVKDTGFTSIGYVKPRISESSKGTREFKSLRLTQALADIEATYRVCERALERDRSRQISLTDDDRNVASQVVNALAGCFNGHVAQGVGELANGHDDVLGKLIAVLNGA